MELEETNLLRLSESECDALQEVAMKQLHKIDLGVALTIPKGSFIYSINSQFKFKIGFRRIQDTASKGFFYEKIWTSTQQEQNKRLALLFIYKQLFFNSCL